MSQTRGKSAERSSRRKFINIAATKVASNILPVTSKTIELGSFNPLAKVVLDPPVEYS